MTAASRLSETAARIVSALGPVVGFARPDIGREIAERSEAAGALCAWGGPDDGRPLVWLHGASAGELLGAIPALRALARERPHALLVTYFSLSGRAALERLDPAFASLAPLDIPEELDRVFGTLRPVLLVFAKLDVWPGMVAAARRAGVPVALVNGVVRDRSRRSRPLARLLFRPVYAGLDRVGAASPEDARRLRALGVREEALAVTGDAAFDLALARADDARTPDGAGTELEGFLPARPPGGARLVAGSTWPPDEEALLGALDGGGPGLRWQPVLAPHRPTGRRVREMLARCRETGRPAVRFSELARATASGAATPDVPGHAAIVVDEVGRLAELYTTADAAYVGGGFGRDGLHNPLEPAAAGIPVVFGPRFGRGDARALVSAGGALACRPEELAGLFAAWLDPAVREPIGGWARRAVEDGAGAGAATGSLLASAWRAGPRDRSAAGVSGADADHEER